MGAADEVIAELGHSQHSVFLGAQAVERGLTRKMLWTRVAAGRLDRLEQDLYHVSGTPVTWEARLLGHVLSAGEGALASHRAAAAVWGFEGFPAGRLSSPCRVALGSGGPGSESTRARTSTGADDGPGTASPSPIQRERSSTSLGEPPTYDSSR